MAVSDPVGTISKLSVQGGFLRLLKDDTDYWVDFIYYL